mmetsp:Transcript_18484/g.30863  ORF Transcript_18484/g.30863 Transcript_18484/m.30863 type:complete len:205 (+) Transcript_18484:306-920(+)
MRVLAARWRSARATLSVSNCCRRVVSSFCVASRSLAFAPFCSSSFCRLSCSSLLSWAFSSPPSTPLLPLSLRMDARICCPSMRIAFASLTSAAASTTASSLLTISRTASLPSPFFSSHLPLIASSSAFNPPKTPPLRAATYCSNIICICFCHWTCDSGICGAEPLPSANMYCTPSKKGCVSACEAVSLCVGSKQSSRCARSTAR